LFDLLVGLISPEKRQEFKSPEGCQMDSTLVKKIKTSRAKFAKIFFGYNQMTNPAVTFPRSNLRGWQRPEEYPPHFSF
jgi:hypothetical protein